MYSTEQASSTKVQGVHAGVKRGRGWVQHSVCCGWDRMETSPAPKGDTIYTNMGIPGVTDILPDEVNLIHLRIILATGFMTSMLPVHSKYMLTNF